MKTIRIVALAVVAVASVCVSNPGAARDRGAYPTVRPFFISAFPRKMLVGEYRPNARWECLASDGRIAYVSFDTSETQARNTLRAIGFHRAVCHDN